jgi:uncharacterized membrane protein YgaE (UPF0421/DUF939 family)
MNKVQMYLVRSLLYSIITLGIISLTNTIKTQIPQILDLYYAVVIGFGWSYILYTFIDQDELQKPKGK